MVGFPDRRRVGQQEENEMEGSLEDFLPSEELAPSKPKSSSSSNNKNSLVSFGSSDDSSKAKVKKQKSANLKRKKEHSEPKETKKGWLGGLFRNSKAPEDDAENDNHGSASKSSQYSPHDDSSHSGRDNDDDASKSDDGSTAPSAKVVETYPDSENEFHQVIRNQNWDLLEILLKEYDYKKYVKPPPKKPPRKLRVAKYLPDLPQWKKEVEIPKNPLYGLDDLGRAPLHLCCIADCPDKPLLRLLFCARDVASVSDATGSLPIHLAVTHDKGVEVVDKLIRGYYRGAMELDATKRTPLMWAIEMIKRQKEQQEATAKLPANHTYWAHPPTKEAAAWQAKQAELWKLVSFMLDNRVKRRQKIQPYEYRQIVNAMGLAAPPQVASLFLDLGKAAMQRDAIAGPALSICISRQYPLELLEKLVEALPMDFAKEHKDNTGRGVVAAHYRIGCIAHQDDSSDDNSKRQSFRMIMQNLANAVGNLQEKITPPKEYVEWWDKLKFLINLWGSHTLEDDASHDDFDMDDLLLHNALSNPDVPPSLIRLLASLRPQATDLEHPKSTALPIHLACRLWRYRHFPPRRGEKELHMDKVVLQLLEGDYSRTRKRYRDRLPLQHAVASGKNWQFLKPLVVHDRKSLQVRDPNTKLYPFQLAASFNLNFDMEALARQKYTNMEWKKMTSDEKIEQVLVVERHYNLEQLSVIFELLRYGPQSIDHQGILQEAAARSAARPKRKIVMEEVIATDEVALSMQIKMVRTLFGLGNVSAHFIAWAYENTRRGWKTHRSNFAVIKEAIMDGLIPTAMDKWWRKLKFWIWQDCPWESPAIPRRDDFLLHGALCNPDVSPWIIDLLLECFPRSASIPLPNSDGCYPLHIACVTDRYVGLPFEFQNKRTVIEMTAKAYPDACLLKWKSRLPLHLAIVHSKDWDEIRYLADEEPVALAVADPKLGFFPFQLMAMNRPYSKKQRSYFEMIAQKEVGKQEWKNLSAHDKVVRMSQVLEKHEVNALGGVWELLKRNPVLVAVARADYERSFTSKSQSSGSEEEFIMSLKKDKGSMSSSGSDWMKQSGRNGLSLGLSMASLDFLEDVFEEDNVKTAARKSREDSRLSMSRSSMSFSFEGSISDPFLEGSFQVPPGRQQNIRSIESKPVNAVPKHSKGRPPRPPSTKDDSLTINEDEEFEIVDYAVEGEETVSEFEYVEEVIEEAPYVSLDVQKKLELGPYDHKELCYPRRKDILFIRKGQGHVVWRNQTLKPGDLKMSSRRSYWAKVFQQMGEMIDLDEVHLIRHEREQTFLGSIKVDATTLFVDEDDTYVWVLCGEEACSLAEGYDIEAAIVVASSLADKETGVWLHPFLSAGNQAHELSGKDDQHKILDWILGIEEKGFPEPSDKRFVITRSMLRNAFAVGAKNSLKDKPAEIIENASRRLWFEVAREKMEHRIKKRRFIGVKYFTVRRAAFERQRLKFSESQKKVKFFKRLKKRQRHAARRESSTHGSSNIFDQSATSDATPPPQAMTAVQQLAAKFDHGAVSSKDTRDLSKVKSKTARNHTSHLENIHQPSHTDDDASINANDVFDEPRGPPPSKPLVAAALKAKKDAEGRSGVHLLNLHQPKAPGDDDDSIASDDLFDPPRGPPPKKPLLAAALRAKQQAEEAKLALAKEKVSQPKAAASRRKWQTNPPTHLKSVNQPRTIHEDDDISLATRDVFDPPREPPPDKPLLAAALKAKEKQDREARALARRAALGSDYHLRKVHQPKQSPDDDISLAQSDIFDPPRGPPPSKPLLAAALKAKEKQDRDARALARRAALGSDYHLRKVHQPKQAHDDDISLAQSDIFDPPRGPPPSKPLLAAALKAKEQRDRQRYTPSHLQKVHQPATIYEDDDDMSLAMGAVFDPPRPPPPAKPLLAAALKAKEERERGIFKSPKRSKSILKASHFTSPTQIGEGSMDMGEIYMASPSQRPGPANRDGADVKKREPAPMTAKLIRMNSVDRLHLHDHDNEFSPIPMEIEMSPGTHKKRLESKKSKRRASGKSKVPARTPSKVNERPERSNSKQESSGHSRLGFMNLLGRRGSHSEPTSENNLGDS